MNPWEYLQNQISYDEMLEKGINVTRQFAKRQMTWLRKETECHFIDPNALDTPKVLKNLKILLS